MTRPRRPAAPAAPPGQRAGTLFVVATPIGNLGDCSARLRETLAACSLVLCEDTRRTGALLSHLGVAAKLLTCHEHDEQRRIPEILERLRGGEDVALVSDAGTPCLSDPGYRLVSAAHDAGLRVSPVPGPSAPLAALSACGIPASSFAFEGFLPRKRSARRKLLEDLRDERRTLVFLEAPHRAAAALDDLAEVLGRDRPACLARELTKLHEEVRRSTLGELAESVGASEVRGEIVLVVAGAPEAPSVAASPDELRARFDALLARGVPEREALQRAARASGVSRREAYRILKTTL